MHAATSLRVRNMELMPFKNTVHSKAVGSRLNEYAPAIRGAATVMTLFLNPVIKIKYI